MCTTNSINNDPDNADEDEEEDEDDSYKGENDLNDDEKITGHLFATVLKIPKMCLMLILS
jgi:hypothetical protein